MNFLKNLWLSFLSLIPSPRYIRSLERQIEEYKSKIALMEDEHRQIVNGLLLKAGLSEITVTTPGTATTPPPRLKFTPSSWRRRNEQMDLENVRLVDDQRKVQRAS